MLKVVLDKLFFLKTLSIKVKMILFNKNKKKNLLILRILFFY